MITNKELESRVYIIKKTLTDMSATQDIIQQKLTMLQQSIESLVSYLAVLNLGHQEPSTLSIQESSYVSASILGRAELQFPSFDGINYREWGAKAEQFFELEFTLVAQRGKLLLLSMDGKALLATTLHTST